MVIRERPPQTPIERVAEEPDLGSDLIDPSRYTSTEFAQLEWDRMWTQVWLNAGRVSDDPEPIKVTTTMITSLKPLRSTTAVAPSPVAGMGRTAGSPAPAPSKSMDPPLSKSITVINSGKIRPVPRPVKLKVNVGEQNAQSSGSPASPSSE